MKAEQAGVETGSKMIAIRDRYRTDLVCRVENMSSCMPNIKGMVTSELHKNGRYSVLGDRLSSLENTWNCPSVVLTER